MSDTMLFTTSVQLHQDDIELPLTYEELGIPEGAHFGMFVCNVSEIPMNTQPTVLMLTIDTSGSMNEGFITSKIVYVKKTVANILRVICDKNMPIQVQIGTFNDHYTQIIEATKVTTENLSGLIATINAIEADGGTNIDAALADTSAILAKYSGDICHFFLTDGEATEGECCDTVLIQKYNGTYPTAFIGYGCNHNSSLLVGLSKKDLLGESTYQLVDDFETVGKLCGELLFNICYRVARNIQLCSETSQIYNAMTNTWSNQKIVGSFVSGKTYRYPIYTVGDHPAAVGAICNELLHGTLEITHTDLTKYVFRYATDRLLYMAVSNKVETNPKVQDLYKKVREYARAHDLMKDTFYKLMFDDLYTCYTGKDMSIQARIVSNTQNQTFRSRSATIGVRRQPNTIFRATPIHRSIHRSMSLSEDEEVDADAVTVANDYDMDDILMYRTDNTQNTILSTPAMRGIVHAVSQETP